ncbi:unnamed protein product, partial [Fusarium langsethiae]
ENADGNEKTDEKELKWTEDDAFVLEVEDFESIDDKSPSQIEWSRRKREENQQNEHLDRLMCIVGHEEVKAFFLSIMDKVKVLKLWDKNLSDWSFDLVLKGNYGTRRNRIAQLYAEFLYSIGIVRNRNFAINDGYSPSEQDSMATVVFFSDADRIDRKSEIEEIMKVAKKPEFRTVVILSYEVLSDSSKEALDVNEESRHRFSNHLVLEDYGEKETLEFMKHLCKSKPEYRFEADALLETLAKQIHKRHSGNQFQNADTLPQELEKVWQKSQIRVQDAWYSWAKTHSPGDGHEFSAEGGDRDKIIIEDILETATAPEPAAEIEDFRVNSPAWKSLQQLVGLKSRRADKHRNSLFQDFVGFDSVIGKFQRYQKMADGMRRCGVDPKLHIPWAFVFSGPPGTGKTSTARKVGRLFYDMGFISSADVVTCSVTNLIGQHLGTTGPKVIDQFERGLGKVLFIDEAYRLIGDSYHQDAVGEIVDTMTNPRYARNMVVILAGYGKEMETLLSTNPGLRSRFPTVIDFPHMSPEHCLQLLSNLLATFNIGIPKSIVQPGGAENTTVIRALTQLTATEGWASGRDIESLSKNVAEHVFAIVGESDDTYEPGTLQVSFEELMDALRAMLNQKGGTWSRLMEEENYPEYAGRQQRFGKVLPPRYV